MSFKRLHDAWNIRTVGVTSSTNDDVRALARTGAPAKTVVVARRQVRGRGQWNREWKSPEGGLYFSFLLRPATPVCEWPEMSTVIASAVRESLIGYFGIDSGSIRVKLPNDIVCDQGKLCGIILEAFDGDCLVVGVGVNVFPPVERIVTDGRNTPAFALDLARPTTRGTDEVSDCDFDPESKAAGSRVVSSHAADCVFDSKEVDDVLDGLLENILDRLDGLL